jgi:carbonic anhydrase
MNEHLVSYSYKKPSESFKRIKAFLINDNEIPDNIKENQFVEEVSYSYDENEPYGPSNWYKMAPLCNGSAQSPIALNSRNFNRNTVLKPLKIDFVGVLPGSIKYDNSGHSVKLTFQYKNGKPAVLRGGPLGNVPYFIDSLHWHWGEDLEGSEHTLDNVRYAAEVHLVSYNSRYGMD